MFEWDENKRQINLEKHKVDFQDMLKMFDGRPVFEYVTARGDEERFGTVGLIENKFYLIIWTQRNERKRIISAYKADEWEIREYRRLYG